ncbi:MAG: hypothetical protein IKR92_03065 [Alphaproteobacteria bacterium]|nr:hypothetical protein [Alphaproteobacteria bacterium]
MEKGLKIVFWTMFGVLFFGVVYLTVVMYLSPRQDMQERGFIPCTKQLVIALQDCPTGKLGCPFKLLAEDMACNIGVVGTGAANWVKGKQPTPWANYLFEPQLSEADDVSAENKQSAEMDALKAQSRFVEQKLKELEEAKHRQLNILPSELLQEPEQEPEPVAEQAEDTANTISDDISAETAVRFEKSAPDGNAVEVPHGEVDVLKKIHNVTQEKLQKGNLKDEK